MRELINKQIEENYEKRMAHNLQRNSFSIKNTFTIGDQSIEKAREFFYNVILSVYKNRIPRKIDQKEKDFFCFAANLHFATEKKPLKVKLGSKANNANLFPSRFIIDLVHILYENGYIELKIGFRAKNKLDSRVSRIWGTKKLHDELFSHKDIEPEKFQVVENADLIILRDGDEKKTPIKFRPSKETNRLRKDLQLINEVNRQFSIQYRRPGRAATRLISDLHAVFNNGTFENGGRFYTGKHGYQSIYRQDRKTVTINGNETVELDYSSLHPYILYAKVGIQAEGDQYKMVNPDEKLRPVLKNALLTLLNADSEKDMVKAGNHFLYKNYELYNIMRERNLNIYDLLKWFKSAHHKISHFFCTGQGVNLMNIDSEIAKSVLLHFANKNEACLCIHDSFIVESKNENYLKNIMRATYEKIISERFNTGIKFTCKVELSL